jgi:hypothetical protein
MLEQARKCGETATNDRSLGAFLLALHPLPRYDGAMIDLTQGGCRGDAECPHEVPHVEPVGAAGLRTFLLRQPDFFFGDGGELVEPRELDGSAGRDGQGGGHPSLIFLWGP